MGKFVRTWYGLEQKKRAEATSDNPVARATADGVNQILDQQDGRDSRPRDENKQRVGLGTATRRDGTSVGRKTLLGR